MGVLRLEKSYVEQRLLQLIVHRFDLHQGCQLGDADRLALQTSHQDLIAHDHDGLGKVDAVRIVLRGNSNQELTEPQIIVNQAGVLRAEQDCDLLLAAWSRIRGTNDRGA